METATENGFPEAELLILQERDVGTFAKTWLVFHRLGLRTNETREELQIGFQPWNAPNCNSLWVFDANKYSVDQLTEEEGKAEWNSFMRYWCTLTLKNMKINILNTPNLKQFMITSGHSSLILDYLNIFVEPISQQLYNSLKILQYPNLYTPNTTPPSNETYILFGPGVIATRSTSSTANVFNTGSIHKTIVLFQMGCGKVYDFQEEEHVYYDNDSLLLINEEEFAINTYNVPVQVTRTQIEVVKTTQVQQIALTVQNDDKMFTRGEEIEINLSY